MILKNTPISKILAIIGADWKIISLLSILGIFCALISNYVTPRYYEAQTKIHIAKVIPIEGFYYPSAPYIESANELVSRLKYVNSSQQSPFRECINKKIALTFIVPKGVEGNIGIRARAFNSEDFNACFKEILNIVNERQREIFEAQKKFAESIILTKTRYQNELEKIPNNDLNKIYNLAIISSGSNDLSRLFYINKFNDNSYSYFDEIIHYFNPEESIFFIVFLWSIMWLYFEFDINHIY